MRDNISNIWILLPTRSLTHRRHEYMQTLESTLKYNDGVIYGPGAGCGAAG